MDAFLLARLSLELGSEWGGSHVQTVWEDVDGRLVLRLRARGKTGLLLVSANPRSSGLGLLGKRPPCPPRPTALAAYLRAHLVGSRLVAARAARFERTVEFEFSGPEKAVRLYLEATGRRGNLIAVDAQGTVRAASRWEKPEKAPLRPLLPGQPYRPPPIPAGLASPDEVDPAELASWIASGEPLQTRVLGFGPLLSKEIRHRAEFESSWRVFRDLAESYGALGPIWEYGIGLSAVRLTHLGEPVAQRSDGLFRAGASLIEELGRADHAERDRDAARAAADHRTRIGRRIRKIESDLLAAPNPEEIQLRAEALAGQLWTVQRGAGRAEIPDPRDPGRLLEVLLDPSISPGENVDRLYRKARAARKTRTALAERLAQSRTELEAGPGADAQRGPKGLAQPDGPFRRYVSSDGWAIWVGRNGSENDRLVREARPWDLWLHAREAPGAHVLVRKPGREAKIPERTLVEAAGLAALHSRRSGENAVEVMAVEAGRIRKPKGASPGRVVTSGERTIRVAPGAGNPSPAFGRSRPSGGSAARGHPGQRT